MYTPVAFGYPRRNTTQIRRWVILILNSFDTARFCLKVHVGLQNLSKTKETREKSLQNNISRRDGPVKSAETRQGWKCENRPSYHRTIMVSVPYICCIHCRTKVVFLSFLFHHCLIVLYSLLACFHSYLCFCTFTGLSLLEMKFYRNFLLI